MTAEQRKQRLARALSAPHEAGNGEILRRWSDKLRAYGATYGDQRKAAGRIAPGCDFEEAMQEADAAASRPSGAAR